MRVYLAVGLLIAGLVAIAFAADEPKPSRPELAVRIVPNSQRDGKPGAITLYNASSHFYVVVTNVSAEPLRLWREWCSWGNQTLSFEVTDEKGAATVVRKKFRNYDKNYPDWTTLPPGGHMIFEVNFSGDRWNDSPLPPAGKSTTLKLRAVYSVSPTGESDAKGVWVGKVTSPTDEYTIYR